MGAPAHDTPIAASFWSLSDTRACIRQLILQMLLQILLQMFFRRSSTYAHSQMNICYECLSAFGELYSGFISLAKADETLPVSAQFIEVLHMNDFVGIANAHGECKSIELLFKDARQCL